MKKKIEFPVTQDYPLEDIQRTQKRLLEIAKIILNILDQNNIKYMISFGTLLGSVRHKGFIPWDDDFDIFIFDDDYDRALQVLQEHLPDDMILHNEHNDPIYWPYWSRIRDLKSVTYSKLWPNDNKYKYRGINFDLYKLEKIKKKNLNKHLLWHKLRHQYRLNKANIISFPKFFINILKMYPKYLIELFKTIFNNNTDEIYFFVFKLHSLTHDSIFPLKKYDFEDMTVWGPNNYDYILKMAYGNYMELPPYNMRNSHYTWVKFDDDR